MNMKQSYKDKERDQWTPDDVAQAIADGYYTNGQAQTRAMLENIEPQPESIKYLRNREKRLMTVMLNITEIGKHRGVHPFDIASQYWPELHRVRVELAKRVRAVVQPLKAAA